MKKLLLVFFALPIITFGQTTINFDDPAKWTAGTVALTSYGNNHTYNDGSFSSTCINCLRETIADAAGTPGANGTYAYRLRNQANTSFVATISSGGVSTFSVNIRRWDDNPNPQFDIEYSTNGGTSWTLVTTVNNTTLDNSSAYKVFNGTIDSPNSNILVRVSNLNYGASERVMVDDFSWSPYVAPGCNISSADLTALTCNDNNTDSDPADDYVTFSLNPTGNDLGATYSVSVSSGTITPTSGTYGSATSFRLQDGSAGAGDIVVTITDEDESSCTLDVTINDPGTCSSTTPELTVAPSSLAGFNHLVGTPSASQTFTVSGIALTDDITVTAPTGFEISSDNITYGTTVSLTPASGTVAATTLYARGNSSVYGAFSGAIVASSTGADNDTVTVSGFANDYVYYTIDQINDVDANGAGDSLGVLVTITGVLHCMDFRAGNGYNMTIIDGSGKGMYIFSNSNVGSYTNPVAGDSIRVKGEIAQFNGLLQVVPVEINLLASAATNAPIVVTTLDESTENQYITLENVTLVTPIATFPASDTNLDVTDGTTTFRIRILASTNLGGTPAPQGPFNVTGIGTQFDTSSPYTSGYQLIPCGTDAIEIVCAGVNLPDVTVVSTMGHSLGAVATGVSYQWINCADNSEISGETNQTFEPSVSGIYAVIIDNGTCADTSECIPAGPLSVNGIELANQIVAYPNPVNDQLTIKNYSGVEATFTITDINGKIVMENEMIGAVKIVNTESWNKGVYFVRFSDKNNDTHTLKVVK